MPPLAFAPKEGSKSVVVIDFGGAVGDGRGGGGTAVFHVLYPYLHLVGVELKGHAREDNQWSGEKAGVKSRKNVGKTQIKELRLMQVDMSTLSQMGYQVSKSWEYLSDLGKKDTSDSACTKRKAGKMIILPSRHRAVSWAVLCAVCNLAVSEIINLFKDPDNQCKVLVFEYAPLILANVEQFLEKQDICTNLHTCDVHGPIEEASLVSNN
ncbi:hypothetical protein M8C21_000923 [Ambrosia artemisiifolia]|uniref:Saposin B type region 2 domain-containing protein n=1 Tax=Ambrosia artemisiifolia TaxID=4212 RepID=A0AAD5G7T5_AMBAR|nr:hypothetical protein M8C21_000923 [Ambrosia artemisiifolia]